MVAKIAFLALFILARTEDIENQRKGKICKTYLETTDFRYNLAIFIVISVNLFSVVRFPNSVCAGGSLNGTCYSAEECTTRGGINGGTCAGGYGVCCTCKHLFSTCCTMQFFIIVTFQFNWVAGKHLRKTALTFNQVEVRWVNAELRFVLAVITFVNYDWISKTLSSINLKQPLRVYKRLTQSCFTIWPNVKLIFSQ